MAYDEALAGRLRSLVKAEEDIIEKKMFGGICLLIRGNMACGILNSDLIVRVGADQYETCLAMDHTRVFDITGRIMKGWVMVSGQGLGTDAELAAWTDRGLRFALTLPPK